MRVSQIKQIYTGGDDTRYIFENSTGLISHKSYAVKWGKIFALLLSIPPIVITFSIVVSFIHTYLFMSVEENYTFAALGILKLEGG